MTGSTGHPCPQSGVWRSDCGHREIALSVNETFPPCGGCNRPVNWTLIRPTR